MLHPSNSPSHLLERLTILCCCSYLSDLRYLPRPCPSMIQALDQIASGEYTALCWQKAACYLTGTPIQLHPCSSSGYRQYLLSYYG